MMNGEQYIASLREMRTVVYYRGKRVESLVDHPGIRPHINAAAMTYELAHDPEYEDLLTATSHLTGQRINRFTHIHQSTEDLVKKVKMLRAISQKTGTCYQRCVGFDAINALYGITYEMDQKKGTDYHQRLLEFLKYIQATDRMSDGAMTDPKGDRSLPPSKQADPDQYLHVVEKRSNGIIVRGAKVHQTGGVNSHEIIAMPTVALGPDDAQYAVAFAIPSDTKGLTYIFGRQTNDTRKEEGEIDQGNAQFGIVGGEALVVGASVAFGPRAEVKGPTWLAGNDVAVAGRLGAGLRVYARSVSILARVAGDARLTGETIELMPGARIEGDLHYVSVRELRVHPGASVAGRIVREPGVFSSWTPRLRAPGLPPLRPLLMLGLLAAGALLLALFPRFTAAAVEAVARMPVRCLGLGTAILF
ncbi:MAG: hypothetical protein K6U89_19595, partial [Chloroflexi bacterium]|nr:hypothetical protein [Chloroflexota bacterium]